MAINSIACLRYLLLISGSCHEKWCSTKKGDIAAANDTWTKAVLTNVSLFSKRLKRRCPSARVSYEAVCEQVVPAAKASDRTNIPSRLTLHHSKAVMASGYVIWNPGWVLGHSESSLNLLSEGRIISLHLFPNAPNPCCTIGILWRGHRFRTYIKARATARNLPIIAMRRTAQFVLLCILSHGCSCC